MFLPTQLFRPLLYLKINHKTKMFYDWVLPLVLASLTLVLFYYFPNKPNIFGKNGYLEIIQSLVCLLIPFFIAALAAIATFHRPSMDQELDGDPATITVWDNIKQDYVSNPLTRRQFLSFLFGYLSFNSLMIFLCSLFFFMFVNKENFSFFYTYKHISSYAFIFLHSFVFWNLIVTTLIGLFFLTDNINRKP